MIKFLSLIDLFGTEDKLQMHSFKAKQKSGFGGIMSILLYGVSFAYFLYQLIEWTQNNKLPKITTLHSSIEKQETIALNGRFLELENGDSYTIDPFDPKELVLVPRICMNLHNSNLKECFQMQYESIKLKNGQNQNKFFLEQEEIIGTINNTPDSISYQIEIVKCYGTTYQINTDLFTCADKDQTEQYFNSQTQSIKITFYTTDFDTKTKQLYQIPKSAVKGISSLTQQLYTYSLSVNNLNVDDGFLFSNNKQFSYVFDYQVESKGILIDSGIWQGFDSNSLLILIFTLNQTKQITFIEYSKISEILADTGAVISWILQISLIVQQYNEKLCEESTINGIIKMYLPDFSNLILKRNCIGQITTAQINDKYYDPQKITKFVKRLTDIAHSKVSFINLQYEVSRLQYLLTKQLGITTMKDSVNQEKKVENFLDTFDYRIKLSQPDSIINISQGQIDKSNQAEIEDQESAEIQLLESTIGLLTCLSDCNQEKQQNKQKQVDLSIIPKECLKQEDLSGISSPH